MKDSLLERAWSILCNASNGDWKKESLDWQEAANQFREDYFKEKARKEYQEYVILEDKCVYDLTRLIQGWLTESTWRVHGEMTVVRGWFSTTYYQTLVRMK